MESFRTAHGSVSLANGVVLEFTGVNAVDCFAELLRQWLYRSNRVV